MEGRGGKGERYSNRKWEEGEVEWEGARRGRDDRATCKLQL